MLIGRKCIDAKENIYTIITEPALDLDGGLFVVVELDGRLRRMAIDEVHLMPGKEKTGPLGGCLKCSRAGLSASGWVDGSNHARLSDCKKTTLTEDEKYPHGLRCMCAGSYCRAEGPGRVGAEPKPCGCFGGPGAHQMDCTDNDNVVDIHTCHHCGQDFPNHLFACPGSAVTSG